MRIVILVALALLAMVVTYGLDPTGEYLYQLSRLPGKFAELFRAVAVDLSH